MASCALPLGSQATAIQAVVRSLLESVHKGTLTHGDTAWKPRVGTGKLIAVIVLLGLLNLRYRIGVCMLYSFWGFHFIFLICFHRILQKRRL